MSRMACPACNLISQVFYRGSRKRFPLEWICRRCGHEWSTRIDYKDAYEQGCVHYRENRFKECVKSLREAFDLNPPSEWVTANDAFDKLAHSLYTLRRYRDVLVEVSKYLERYPESRSAYVYRAWAYEKLDRNDDAIGANETANKLDQNKKSLISR